MPLVDCHLHTSDMSCDASSPLSAYILQGRKLGLAAICTTEHVDFDPNDYCYGHYSRARHEVQKTEVRAAPDDGLQVLIGVEVDYQRRYEADARQFLHGTDFDYVVGGIHYARGESVFLPSFFDAPEQENVEAYLDEVLGAVHSGLFDVIAHLDIVKRYGVRHYGPFDPTRYADAIDTILRACVETGTGLEINSSGWRGPPKEPFPTLHVLRRYRELGGQVLTVGSDAHHADDLARDIPRAVDIALEAGFNAIAVFADRKPTYLPIVTGAVESRSAS